MCADKKLSASRLSDLRDQFEMMTPSEQRRFREERPNQYRQLTGKGGRKHRFNFHCFGEVYSGELETGQARYRQ